MNDQGSRYHKKDIHGDGKKWKTGNIWCLEIMEKVSRYRRLIELWTENDQENDKH